MGLLDEAIREHLELKRRHGADPGEVARLEHEALGPARQEALEPKSEPPLTAAPVATAPEPVAEQEPPEPEPETPTAPLPEVDQPTELFVAEDVVDATKLSSPAADDVDDEEPEPAPRPTPSSDEQEVVPADEEPEPDDVLEETPEFLQETPEHDRLWFEQKPPRDFDF